MRRYSVKCRICDGSGFLRGMDPEGNNTLDTCGCTRGKRTLVLEPEDEVSLLEQLQANQARTVTKS